ncbi:MAG TPA: DUF2252 family protein [Hyphomicrobiaceae bacterium]|nr:DUF2252 family protein [Hyphomicrobiaceae bacterium]
MGFGALGRLCSLRYSIELRRSTRPEAEHVEHQGIGPRLRARLRKGLGRELVEADLRHRHDRLARTPFSFLRGTYWRGAETIFEVCPDLKAAPVVLAVDDIHLENFGTWRDVEGRLVWGVGRERQHLPAPHAACSRAWAWSMQACIWARTIAARPSSATSIGAPQDGLPTTPSGQPLR